MKLCTACPRPLCHSNVTGSMLWTMASSGRERLSVDQLGIKVLKAVDSRWHHVRPLMLFARSRPLSFTYKQEFPREY